MKRYELSLSENYVSNWGVVEAVREIFQNALDQEIMVKNNTYCSDEDNPNKMFFELGTTHITIGNKASVLDVKSLLLGETTKQDDEKTIGKFGEGYKLALLVLARQGKKVKIYNYGNREVWEPKLRASSKYNGAKTLQIEIQDKYIWQKVPNNNLTYMIDGLTPEEKEAVILSNLHLQPKGKDVLETYYGQILCDSDQAGRIYVNGLFVSYVEKMRYGYNFKPEYIELDRDRRMIEHFNLCWKTSQMWKEAADNRLIELAEDNAEDVKYLNSSSYVYNEASKFQKVAEMAYESFTDAFGEKAYPVVTQQEMDTIVKRRGISQVTPIVVTEAYQNLLNSSPSFIRVKAALPPPVEIPLPADLMYRFYDSVKDKLDGADLNVLWTLVLASQTWRDTK